MRSALMGWFVLFLLACSPRATPDDGRGPFSAGKACTQIGCSNGLQVALVPNERWPAGDYRFEFSSEAGTATCSGSLPLPPCGTPALVCTGMAVQIGESGCALPAAAHGFSDVMLSSTPATLRIDVLHDGERKVVREFRPQYRRVEPNGAGCGPVCTNASERLVVF
jgi:hypothetical protein